MKLSFSFSKAAAPKKQIAVHQKEPEVVRREVVSINEGSAVELTGSSHETEEMMNQVLVIPVKTIYSKPERPKLDLSHVDQNALKKFENTAGIIGDRAVSSGEVAKEGTSGKGVKRAGSILMQIQAAKKRGDIRDAPDVARQNLDPEEFGWALLRGMGYDPDTDTSPDVTKTVVGNRTKLGLGVKASSIALPTEKPS